MAARDLENSNTTSNAFLGGKKKYWMNGGTLPHPPRKATGRVAVNSESPIHASARPVEWPFAVQNSNSIKSHDFSVLPFPPGYDRGCFPFQRRRRGSTKAYSGRQGDPISPSDHLSSVYSPSVEKQIPPTLSPKENGNVENLLPSPTPSDEIGRQSCNIIEVEDGTVEPTNGTNELRTRSEELLEQYGGIDAVEKRLQGSNSSTNAPTNHTPALNSYHEQRHMTSNPAGAAPTLQAETQAVSFQAKNTDSRLIAASHKRTSENPQQSRKRLHNPSDIMLPSSESARLSPTVPHENGLETVGSLNLLIEVEIRGFAEKVAHRLRYSNLNSRPGNAIERPRLELLQDACGRGDCFYLCLHQIFCLEYVRRCLGDTIPNLDGTHRNGLDHLSYLLVCNGGLSADAIKWFSDFPLPLDQLLSTSPVFRSAFEKVRQCLSRLAVGWVPFRDQCSAREYPPLVDELIVVFGAESFTLQQVIYRALLRDIWKGQQDQCYSSADNMFVQSYEARKSLSWTTTLMDAIKKHNNAFIQAYKRLGASHSGHLQQKSAPDMLPPPNPCASNHPISKRTQTPLRRDSDTYQPPPFINTEMPSEVIHNNRPAIRRVSSMSAQEAGHIPGSHNQPRDTPQQSLGNPSLANFRRGSYPQAPIVTSTSRPALVQNATMHGQIHSRSLSRGTTTHNSSIGRLHQPTSQGHQSYHRTLPYNPPLQGSMPQVEGLQVQQPRRPQMSPYQFGQYLTKHTENTNEPRQFVLGHTGQHQSVAFARTQLIRANPNLHQTHANAALNALHQAHVRSPTLTSLIPHGNNAHVPNSPRFFRYITNVIVPPRKLSKEHQHVSWDFVIDKVVAESLVKDNPGSYGSPPTRVIFPGCYLCRVRCIKADKLPGLPSQKDWVVTDCIWPGNTAVVLNGEALEIRKKSHHGRDLPIDATTFIREGKNTISTAIIGLPEDNDCRYAIGVEIIGVIEETLIKSNILVVPSHEARKRILDRSNNVDPDVQVVDFQIVLDITDPFTARIFDIPVRGTSCVHYQCFDRDTFLSTRNSKNPKEPCEPDAFKCPICGSDARPPNLIIDGFFVQLREELDRKRRLDAKAVILHPSGEWEIREDDKDVEEQGDGTGKRHAPARRSVGRGSTPKDVIPLDDD